LYQLTGYDVHVYEKMMLNPMYMKKWC